MPSLGKVLNFSISFAYETFTVHNTPICNNNLYEQNNHEKVA